MRRYERQLGSRSAGGRARQIGCRGRGLKWGSFVIGRKTIKKRMLKQLLAVKMELCKRMHDPIAKTGAWLNQMLLQRRRRKPKWRGAHEG
jgi:hypothetical protein